MRNEPVDFILTALSASMFGDSASIHQKKVSEEVAKSLIGPATQIVATRAAHELLAKTIFGQNIAVSRFVDMSPIPEKSAILIHYRGAPISDDGMVAEGSTTSYYLIESEEYQDYE